MRRLVSLYLPVLFPSWRFFASVGPSPRIEVRINPDDPWDELWPLPVRLSVAQHLSRLFYNANWNRRLYLISTAIRHTTDPNDWVMNELRAGIAARLPESVETFEYRIAFLTRYGDQTGKFVEFESGPVDRHAPK